MAGKAPAPILGDVWCSKCPAPATTELLVRSGRGDPYTAAYCATHAWLVIAPSGRRRPG